MEINFDRMSRFAVKNILKSLEHLVTYMDRNDKEQTRPEKLFFVATNGLVYIHWKRALWNSL